MAKGVKISGRFNVIAVQSVIVGCMSWYTPCLVLQDRTGIRYHWVSDKINVLGLNDPDLEDKWLELTAFVRSDSNNLYRVVVSDAPPEMNYYHRQKAWAADKQLAL